jgi:hypothetical protein
MTITTDAPDLSDIERQLAERGCIGLFWCIADVHEVRKGLTDEQAMEVLLQAEHRYESEHGFNWDNIKIAAEELFDRHR